MSILLFKYFTTAFIIVLVSEIAKQNNKLGALISSLPIITIMVMIWLFIENQNIEKIGKHSYYTFWYVIPTMPMFLIMPWILSKGLNFWWALFICIVITILCFLILINFIKRFGIELIP